MSRLEKLIAELCPDGVEYKSIKEIAEVSTGSSNGNEAVDEGEFPFFVRSQTVKRKNDYEFDEEAIIIPGEGGIGDIYHYVNGKYALHQRVYRIHFINNEINTKFAYYFFASCFKKFILKKAVSATVISIRKPMVERFSIPIPPMEVQREIVRILDKFSEKSTELCELLSAELVARKKQYEYYRNKLLTFGTDVPRVLLEEIADTNIGLAVALAKYKSEKGVLLLHNSDIRENRITLKSHEYITSEFAEKNRKKLLQKDDIITVRTGDSGTSAVITEEFVGAIGFTTITSRIRDKEKVLPKYLSHYLNSQLCKQEIYRVTTSERSNLNQYSYDKLIIPMPPLDTQKKIVAILDKFSARYSALSSSIPAEIAARKKQYEYYTDRLLTFREKIVEKG